MRNKYFRSKDESSLEARFKEQQDQNTSNTSQLEQIAGSMPNVLRDELTLYVGGVITQTGTVTIDESDYTAVVGTGTAFETVFPDGSGWISVYIDEEYKWAEIDSVDDDTHCTLVSDSLDAVSNATWGIPGAGSDSNSGTDPDYPLETIDGLQARLDSIDVCGPESLISLNIAFPSHIGNVYIYLPPSARTEATLWFADDSMMVIFLNGGAVETNRFGYVHKLALVGPGYAENNVAIGEALNADQGIIVASGGGFRDGAKINASMGAIVVAVSVPDGEYALNASFNGGVIIYPGVYGEPPVGP